MNPCNTISDHYMGELSRWAKSNTMPLTGTFELTPFCNFQCTMCYVRLTKEQAAQQGAMLRAEDWIAIANQAKEMGMLKLCLTGGEPLSHPDFWQIYSELNQMGFLLTIMSNGSLIDETVIEKFQEYGAPHCIKLTLYGANDETYWRTCRCKDGFTKVSKAVQLLQDAKIPLIMTSTIVKENVEDLQEIYRFARERNVPMQHSIAVVKSARGATNTAAESRFRMSDFPESLTLERLEQMKHHDGNDPFAHCGSQGTSFFMTWNGHLQLCAFMAKPYVYYSGNFDADWSALNGLLNAIQEPAMCKDCKWSCFCRHCPGNLCAESGDPEKESAGLCGEARGLFELYVKKLEKEADRK